MKTPAVAAALALLLSWALPASAGTCPPEVRAAVQKAHAGANVASCKKEHEDGRTQFSVKVSTSAGREMELDVTPEGNILLTEESVALSDVPPAVMKAFAAKYGTATPKGAEKGTTADGNVSYELAFTHGAAKKEATFASDGSFLEEE